jgi:hypothetical protein
MYIFTINEVCGARIYKFSECIFACVLSLSNAQQGEKIVFFGAPAPWRAQAWKGAPISRCAKKKRISLIPAKKTLTTFIDLQ